MSSAPSTSSGVDLMESMNESDRNLVNDAISKITVEKTQSLVEFVQSLGPRISHESQDEREGSMAVLVAFILRLPKAFLSDAEVDLLLEFFVSRVEDAALIGGCVFSGIHQLVLNYPNLTQETIRSLYDKLFYQGNVQSWTQKDRMLQLEIFERLIPAFRDMSDGNFDFVNSFIQAASGERDPRCLLKVFQLFCLITQQFNLGPFVEDMFEVVACYYPIEFKPKDGDTITREMLAVGCESCLLAHKSFHLYCYQLITEKLLDDDLADAIRIDAFGFLSRACDVFAPDTIYQHIDDILAAVRRIILDPNTKNPNKEAPKEIEEAMRSMVRALEKDEKKRSTGLQSIADILIENCEPFILQAELGFMGKAMCLLKVVAKCNSEFLSEAIIPKVFYWLSVLALGTTTSSANKVEIVAEALALYEQWCELAAAFNRKYIKENINGIFGDILAASERCPDEAHRAEYDCARVLIGSFTDEVDLTVITDRLMKRAPLDYKRPEMRESILSFVQCASERKLCSVDPLLEKGCDPEAAFVLACECMHDIESLNKMAPLITMDLSNNGFHAERSSALIRMATRMKTNSEVLSRLVELVKAVLSVKLGKCVPEEEAFIAAFLQDLGLLLSDEQRLKITEFFTSNMTDSKVKTSVVAFTLPFLLQSNSEEELRSFNKVLTAEGFQVNSIYVQSAYLNKFGEKLTSSTSSEWSMKFRRSVNNARARLLTGGPKPLEEIRNILDTLVTLKGDKDKLQFAQIIIAEELLNFSDRKFSPEKSRLKCSMLWRQRVFCQLVPIIVERFTSIGSENPEVLNAFFAVLGPLLEIGRSVPVNLSKELKMLLPVFTEALKMSDFTPNALELLLGGMSTLLKLAVLSDVSSIHLESMCIGLVRIVENEKNIKNVLSALECLDALVKRGPKDRLLPYHSGVAKGLTSAKASTKRVIRKAAANTMNDWELITV